MKIAGKNLICIVAMMLVCALLLPLSACSEAGKQPADPDETPRHSVAWGTR